MAKCKQKHDNLIESNNCWPFLFAPHQLVQHILTNSPAYLNWWGGKKGSMTFNCKDLKYCQEIFSIYQILLLVGRHEHLQSPPHLHLKVVLSDNQFHNNFLQLFEMEKRITISSTEVKISKKSNGETKVRSNKQQ